MPKRTKPKKIYPKVVPLPVKVPKKREKVISMQVHIKEREKKEIEIMAKAYKLPQAEIIRRAIRRFLDEEREKGRIDQCRPE